MTKARIIMLVFIAVLTACNQPPSNDDLPPLPKIETTDYREIYKQFKSTGTKIFPMVYDKSFGSKRLVFIGISHSNDNDTLNIMYDTILKYFSMLKPNVALNEGGQIPDTLVYPTRNKAIVEQAGIGYLKYLADSRGIKLVNGDCADSIEIPALAKKYDKDALLYFLVTQRFIPQFNAGPKADLDKEYRKFIADYLIKRCHLALSNRDMQWQHFKILYRKNNNEEIDLGHFELSKTENYFYDEGVLGQIGRSSLHIRDSVIVTNIYNSLKLQGRVFIVFGGAHLLSLKPTLDKIFEKSNSKTH